MTACLQTHLYFFYFITILIFFYTISLVHQHSNSVPPVGFEPTKTDSAMEENVENSGYAPDPDALQATASTKLACSPFNYRIHFI